MQPAALTIDVATGAKQVLATPPGFTHGLATYRGVLFVGLSKLRDERRRAPTIMSSVLSAATRCVGCAVIWGLFMA